MRWLLPLLFVIGCTSTGTEIFLPDDDAGALPDGGACTGVDLSRSEDNCGSCGHACARGEVCDNGQCSLFCGGGSTKCGSSCVDVKNDPQSCGACGKACAAGQVCGNGQCGSTCPAGQRACNSACVDTQNDRRHCGACGKACPAGSVCTGGDCVLSCQAGLTICGDAGTCVNTDPDRANCGQCGRACGDGYVCSNGDCVLSCPPPLTTCTASDGGLRCADTRNDPSNCGACGVVCPSDQVCTPAADGGASSCFTNCQGGTTFCAGACRDTRVDNNHCSACNKPCAGGYTCINSNCTSTPNCTNVATGATATSSGGGQDQFDRGPSKMNNGVRNVCTDFHWIYNNAYNDGRWIELTWPSAQGIGGIYVDTENASAPVCGGPQGQNVASAKVQWWNGSSWVTDGAVTGQTDDFRYDFTAPVITTRIRLMDIKTTDVGQGTNSRFYEVYAFSATGCPTP